MLQIKQAKVVLFSELLVITEGFGPKFGYNNGSFDSKLYPNEAGTFVVAGTEVREIAVVKERHGVVSAGWPLFGHGTKKEDPEFFTKVNGFSVSCGPGTTVSTITEVLDLVKAGHDFDFGFWTIRGTVDWCQHVSRKGDAGAWSSAFSTKKFMGKGAVTCLLKRLALFELETPHLIRW